MPSGADEYCPGKDAVTGCAPGHEVFSEWIPHEHELVHAAGTDMPAALEEGLATHWGDPWPFYAMASRERLHALLLQQVDITGVEEYARVAHFLAYLSESHGWESLAELDRQLDADSGVDQVDRAFMDIFGKSLDIALTEYEAFPDCTGIVDVSLSCAKDSITIGFLNPEFVREIDCASSEAIGPYDGMVFVEEVIDLEPSIDGNRIVRALGDGVEKGGHVLVRRCGPCAENGVGVANSSSIAFVDEAELPAGRYIVRLYVPVDSTPAALGLRMSG